VLDVATGTSDRDGGTGSDSHDDGGNDPHEELLQNPLVNSSHELTSGLSDEPLQECLNELLHVKTNDVSVDSLEK